MTKKRPENLQSTERSVEEALAPLEHIPVALLRQVLREEIRNHPNFVLVGETGSGKTTCLPPLFLELIEELNLPGKSAVTQPRRVAARSVSSRVSNMLGCNVGESVGFHIRFEDQTSEETGITYMTDGILLRKIQYDPLLLEYSIVMVDEAHERSLNIDLCLGLLKDVNLRRVEMGFEPIRIIIASATIERGRFARYIGYDDTDNSIEIPGAVFPVQIYYERETPHDYIQAAADKVKQIIDRDLDGDILIFMPGKKEISSTIDSIKALIGDDNCDILPLHSELSPEDQDRIFLPINKRKIIVSTNIAETSVTIDGIIHVIDSGLIKQNHFDPKTGIEHLVLCEHALSGLEQRKGRAGRTAPGYCHRLFSERSLKFRPLYPVPEIQRSNLSQVVLAMKKVGVSDIENFDFLDPPNRASIHQALDTLTQIGALDHSGDITDIGEVLVDLALEPRLGRMILEASKPELDCVNEVCIIAAFLDSKNIFVTPDDYYSQQKAERIHRQYRKESSDFLVMLSIWRAYASSGYRDDWAVEHFLNEKVLAEIKNIRLDLLDALSKHGIYVDSEAKPRFDRDVIGRALSAGLVGNMLVATGKYSLKKVDGTKNDISIHPASVLSNESFQPGTFVLPGEIFTGPAGKTFACNCQVIRPEWLPKEIRGTAKSYSRPVHVHHGNRRNRNNFKHS